MRVTIHIKEPFLQVSSKNHLLTVRVFVSIELEKKHVGSIRLKNLSVVVQNFVFFFDATADPTGPPQLQKTHCQT